MDKILPSDSLLKHLIIKIVFSAKESTGVFLYPEDNQLDRGYHRFPIHIIPEASKAIIYDPLDLDKFSEILHGNSSSEIFLWTSLLGRRNLPAEVQSAFPGMDLHEILLWKAIYALPQGVRLSALMPNSFLTSISSQVARRKIFGEATPKLIINNVFTPATAEILGIHHSFKMSLLVMEKGEENLLLKLFSIPEGDLDIESILDDIHHLQKLTGGKTAFGYVLRDGVAPGETINFEANHPDLVKKANALETFGEIIKLENIAKIFQGINTARYSNALRVLNEAEIEPSLSENEHYLVDGRMITAGNDIDLSMARYVVSRDAVPSDCVLKKGDYCVSFISRNLGVGGHGIKIVEILNDRTPLIAASSVIVIRLDEKISEEQRQFIIAYLKSPLAAKLLKSKSSSVGNYFRLNANALNGLPLPQADEGMLLAIQNLNHSAAQFEKWKLEAEAARDSLFSESSFEDTRLKFLTVGRLARQRQEAALMVEDFNFRVRTQFPHPIAYRWRLIETSQPDLEGYIQVLECAELTVLYLATMAILLAKSVSVELTQLSKMSEKLSSDAKQGATFGEWKAILQEVDSKKFKRIEGVIPFYEVLGALRDPEIDRVVKLLISRRNDQAHKRGPKGSKAIRSAFYESKADLEKFLKAIDFLSEYRLRYIEVTKIDSIKKVTEYTYRDLQGDHPLAPIQSGLVGQIDIEAGSLYLVDRQENLHLLRPYLTRQECPECGSWSVFCLDTYDRRTHSVNLYSMEHGHIVVNTDLVDALKSVGLLK